MQESLFIEFIVFVVINGNINNVYIKPFQLQTHYNIYTTMAKSDSSSLTPHWIVPSTPANPSSENDSPDTS